jgi:hypothetical protein
VAGSKRPSFLKRQKEQKRRARAAEKREARRARKEAKAAGLEPGDAWSQPLPDEEENREAGSEPVSSDPDSAAAAEPDPDREP